MKSPAKKIITAIISGTLLLNAGLLFAKTPEIILYHHGENSHDDEDKESEERRHEFWEKFRESVKPREKEPPKEVQPEEVEPEEEKQKEIE